jgi:hypothetical protein
MTEIAVTMSGAAITRMRFPGALREPLPEFFIFAVPVGHPGNTGRKSSTI